MPGRNSCISHYKQQYPFQMNWVLESCRHLYSLILKDSCFPAETFLYRTIDWCKHFEACFSCFHESYNKTKLWIYFLFCWDGQSNKSVLQHKGYACITFKFEKPSSPLATEMGRIKRFWRAMKMLETLSGFRNKFLWNSLQFTAQIYSQLSFGFPFCNAN